MTLSRNQIDTHKLLQQIFFILVGLRPSEDNTYINTNVIRRINWHTMTQHSVWNGFGLGSTEILATTM